MRLFLLLFAASVCAQQKSSPFIAGRDDAHSFRIPSLVVTSQGTLVVACEARRKTWVDKSPTDIVTRRSIDGGTTWEVIQTPLYGGKGAMMDPVLVTNPATGHILLLAIYWPTGAEEKEPNQLHLVTSLDDGRTWSQPRIIPTSALPAGTLPQGLGPGAGIAISDNRLFVPIRLTHIKGKHRNIRNHAISSGDGGLTWNAGGPGNAGGEFQFAQAPNGKLIALRRNGTRRMQSSSDNLGVTWSEEQHRPELVGIEKGCQGCIFRAGDVLLHSAPAGITETPGFDNRGRLTLYRSTDSGTTWSAGAILHPKAAGYSCMAQLKDGRIAIVWESADTPSFPRSRERQAGWMRMDFYLMPAAVADPSKPLVVR